MKSEWSLGWAGRLWIAALVLLVAFAFPLPWPETTFMPDTLGYADAVEAGRWVAHAPGYPFFVGLGRLFNLALKEPVASVQWSSFVLYLGSIVLMSGVFWPMLGRGRALLLAGSYAVAWIPLYFSRSGTNHAADLFTVALMIFGLGCARFGQQNSRGLWIYCGAMVLCAGFRLPSFLMLAPLFVVVLFIYHRRWLVWAGYGLAALAVIGVQAFAIACFGGWESFRLTSAQLADGTDKTSILLSGLTPAAGTNFARAFLWYGMTGGIFGPVLLVALRAKRRAFLSDRRVWMACAAIFGPLGVNALYLSTHPGYLAVAVPGTFWLVALAWEHLQGAKWLAWVVVAAAVMSGGFFLGFRIFDPPRSPAQAVLNGFVLQYSRDGIDRQVWRPAAEWLLISGDETLIPGSRRKSLETYLKFRESKNLTPP